MSTFKPIKSVFVTFVSLDIPLRWNTILSISIYLHLNLWSGIFSQKQILSLPARNESCDSLGREGSICSIIHGLGNERCIWRSLRIGSGLVSVWHSVFECSFRRIQPLNWDRAHVELNSWVLHLILIIIFFFMCKTFLISKDLNIIC